MPNALEAPVTYYNPQIGNFLIALPRQSLGWGYKTASGCWTVARLRLPKPDIPDL